MKLNTLSPAPGSKKNAKRVGRGIGSGSGKTCGRGHKGQHSRSGGYLKVYSQGAQFFYEFQTKTFNSDTGEFEVDQRGAGVPLVDDNGLPIPLTQLDAVVNSLELDFFNISQRNEKAEQAYNESKLNK